MLANALASLVPPRIRRCGFMTDTPWLTIIGLHEDGLARLSHDAVICLKQADVIMAPPRHLAHLNTDTLSVSLKQDVTIIDWPVPYDNGISQLLALRGQQVVVLASGDPFHYGAGASITRHLDAGEWQSFPLPSSFSMIASALGWPLETTQQIGLHAKPIQALRPLLGNGVRIIALLRDGDAVCALALYLAEQGYSDSLCHIFSKLTASKNSFVSISAKQLSGQTFDAPVAVGIELISDGLGIDAEMPLASGKPDSQFIHDGQITKQLIRAMSLSALAPRPNQHLLDIGSGSGSIAIEWMLTHPSLTATAIEIRDDRVETISANARQFGLNRLTLIKGDIAAHSEEIQHADTVFIGGGLDDGLIQTVWQRLKTGGRLVINAVTAESEALVISAHNRFGGTVTKIELSDLAPIGRKHGWKSRYPIVQWVIVKDNDEAGT